MIPIWDIIKSRAEGSKVDFKESFVANDHGWISLVKDIVAFANRDGGYIVFGIKDKTCDVVGIDEKTKQQLIDPNAVKQKLSKYVKADISINIALCNHEHCELLIIEVIKTNSDIFPLDNDGNFKNESGAEKYLFYKGQIWIRGDGGNELLIFSNQSILRDAILRTERSRIMEGLSRVVLEPTTYKLVSSDEAKGEKVRFVSGDPTAQRITFDVDQAGKLFSGEAGDLMEVLRAANKPHSDIDDRLLAKYLVSGRASTNQIKIDNEILFILSCKIIDFPKYASINYDKQQIFTEKSNAYLLGCSEVAQKGRIISGIKVLNRDKGKELSALLKTDEKKQVQSLIKDGRKNDEQANSMHYLDRRKPFTTDEIWEYIKDFSEGRDQLVENRRTVVASDYKMMREVIDGNV